MHRFPWEAASPLKDRLLTIEEDDSEDSSAGAGDDLSNELDHTDESDLDADEGGQEDPYKKRYSDTKSDRDKWKKTAEEKDEELRSLREENEALRRVGAQTGTRGADYGDERKAQHTDEVQLVESIAASINQEYLSLPKDKQNVTGLAKIMVSKQLGATKELAVKIAQEIIDQRQSQVNSKQQLRTMAETALSDIGLDPKRHYRVMRTIIQDRVENDPEWFRRTPIPEQFKTLAKETRDELAALGVAPKEDVRKANQEHRREADGMIGSGARRATARQEADDAGDDERPSTMIDAMNANHRNLRRRAGTFAGPRR